MIIESGNMFFESIPTYRILERCEIGKEYVFETHLEISEWNIAFYMFYDDIERNIFLNLKKVSKLGGKSALKILQKIDVEQLINMIASQDVKGLSKLPGIGKKTAERIINELGENLETLPVSGESTKLKDALEALEALGFEKNKVFNVLKEIDIEKLTLENIITQALKKL
ncbi:hypothetical protein XO10_08740 [Marinitoga sp. 1135]|nr:hypothetical protein [Marinitoga sp. 1135]NUU98287.1 hypothetical protein [Marinitoga sp. 1138]